MSAIFGETLRFAQENGPDVSLVVFGDEFYGRYETPDGYTVVYDTDLGQYTYAILVNGRLASSGTPITKRPPLEIRRHLREAPEVRNDKFEQRYNMLRPREAPVASNLARTLGPNEGLLPGRRASEGTVRGLTILVQFADVTSSVTADDINDLLNGDNYRANGNFSSVREYFRLVSTGRLDYTNEVVGPVTLSHHRGHYEQNLLVPEALDLAVTQFGLDLSRFDSNGDDVVDALNIMYAGRSVYQGDLWPHSSVQIRRYNGTRTHFYQLTSMGRSRVDLSIGTFCHENGHMLCRFPDMYDYGKRDGDFEKSQGIGVYCLMGSGNHLNYGRTPAPVCAYLRHLIGWTGNEILLNDAGRYEARQGDYGSVLRYETEKPNEYFIIENRAKRGLDAHLPSSGLAIYHCDTLGSNEWQEGTRNRHYQCALLQADGHLDLENNRNLGDAGDLFDDVGGAALSHDTIPSSLEWDGSDSKLQIANISEPGDVIQFDVGPTAATQVAHGSAMADELIPDDKKTWTRSPIALAESGTLKAVRVSVGITHTYIGDLQVVLETPSGKSVTLHDRAGGHDDDLQVTYESAGVPSLAALADEPIAGTWLLKVRDLAAQDIGRLNRWSIEIEYTSADEITESEASPGLAIPDADVDGVTSTILVEKTGNVKDLLVNVDIAHTYIGDLMVEVVAPSGQGAIIHDRAGGNRDNLRRTFNRESTPALEALLNEPIQGSWKLKVRDLATLDQGQLDKWGLKLIH